MKAVQVAAFQLSQHARPTLPTTQPLLSNPSPDALGPIRALLSQTTPAPPKAAVPKAVAPTSLSTAPARYVPDFGANNSFAAGTIMKQESTDQSSTFQPLQHFSAATPSTATSVSESAIVTERAPLPAEPTNEQSIAERVRRFVLSNIGESSSFYSLTIRARLLLLQHRECVTHPEVETPFTSLDDTLKRLLPFHMLGEPVRQSSNVFCVFSYFPLHADTSQRSRVRRQARPMFVSILITNVLTVLYSRHTSQYGAASGLRRAHPAS